MIEGETDLPRTVVLRFDSREAAMSWYDSPAYQAVPPLRLEATGLPPNAIATRAHQSTRGRQ